MGMHDPHSDDYRPYKPNSATPIPAPVIQNVDLQAAIDSGDLEPAQIVEPEGDGQWAVDATEHVDAATPEGDDLPGFEPPATSDTDDYGNPERHRGESWEAPVDPDRDNGDAEDGEPDADDPSGTTVADLPAENGADLEDCDPGFIPAEDGDPDATPTAHEHSDGAGGMHSHDDGNYDHDSHD